MKTIIEKQRGNCLGFTESSCSKSRSTWTLPLTKSDGHCWKSKVKVFNVMFSVMFGETRKFTIRSKFEFSIAYNFMKHFFVDNFKIKSNQTNILVLLSLTNHRTSVKGFPLFPPNSFNNHYGHQKCWKKRKKKAEMINFWQLYLVWPDCDWPSVWNSMIINIFLLLH